MRNKFSLVFFLFFLAGSSFFSFHSATGQTQNCKLVIPSSEGTIDGHSNASEIQPGDTICLMPGQKPYLRILYIHGSPEKPVVIINTIGIVDISGFYYGIKIDSCSYVKLSGKGVSISPYGINVNNVEGAGMSIEGLSTDIEVEGIEIFNTLLVGIFCKSDPDCSFTSTRDHYVMRNVSIHDNYIHDTGMEGFYIGNSYYTGFPIQCNGLDTILLPHLIRGLSVYNNRLTRTDWDGLQVSSADSGCAIFNNEIAYDSQSAELNQMSGIIMGEGSVCDCYNNKILEGKGNGIQVLGLGGNKVFNNLILNAGRTFFQEYPYMNGIYVGYQSTTPGSNFLIAYNTIISPRDYGIDFRSESTTGNQFINNIVMNYGRELILGNNITLQNNLTSPVLDQTQFVDAPANNYDLDPESTAVNMAVQVPQMNLDYDILNRGRPFAQVNDIGAYECHDSSLIAIPDRTPALSFGFNMEPDYLNDILIIRYTLSSPVTIQIGLYEISGKMIEMIVDKRVSEGDHEQQMDITDLKSGIYIVRMYAGNDSLSKKIQLNR
ncbi:MAG: right-handed parallel beta-helix repeat-containing protein [Bacteroidales bacterium]|nr:right-handed parallel beta-helix repeat-containing protein [Bacteroidales bacterium]